MVLSTRAAGEDKLTSVARQMSKWMDHVLKGNYHKYSPDESWSPAINLYEDESQYWVVVDLAGVKAEHIDLRVSDGVLIFSGERSAPSMKDPSGQLEMHLMEIDHGRFCRTLELPSAVDVDSVSAEYRNGYLWIRLPKSVVRITPAPRAKKG